MCIVFAALACAIRPTNAIIWVYMFSVLFLRLGHRLSQGFILICDCFVVGLVAFVHLCKAISNSEFSQSSDYPCNFCARFSLLWQTHAEFVEFFASQCVARIFVLRLQPLALLPVSGSPYSLFYILAIRAAWYASCSAEQREKFEDNVRLYLLDIGGILICWT